jgi:hypothetical protein
MIVFFLLTSANTPEVSECKKNRAEPGGFFEDRMAFPIAQRKERMGIAIRGKRQELRGS